MPNPLANKSNSLSEIQAVLAHEIGHLALNHYIWLGAELGITWLSEPNYQVWQGEDGAVDARPPDRQGSRRAGAD